MSNTRAILVLIGIVTAMVVFCVLGITGVVTGGVVMTAIGGAVATLVAALTEKII